MSDWIDRLQPVIKLTSPQGNRFEASWQGNSRSLDKALGIFKFPRIKGAIIQDLDVIAPRYPLTFYFDGADHDITANQFFNACAETGTWQIEHPVRGLLILQLVNVTEDIEPVESGNVTKITSEWIEPMESQAYLTTVPELVSVIEEQVFLAQGKAVEQFTNNASVEESGPLATLVASVEDAVSAFHETLDPISNAVSDVYNKCTVVYSTLTGALRAAVMDIMSVGKKMQMLATFPIDATNSVATKLTFYSDLLEKMILFTPPALTTRSKKMIAAGVNQLAVQELVLTSIIAGVATSLVTADDITNRDDAIYYIDFVTSLFDTVTATLDAGQDLYAASPIGVRYFSQSQSFDAYYLLVSQVKTLLLKKLFNLSVAKRFTLQTARCPVEIAITEGVDLDTFITTNKLKYTDIMLLPQGKQVVVYI